MSMTDYKCCPANLWFYDTPFSHTFTFIIHTYYIYIYNDCNNRNSSIICFRLSGDMYLSLGIPVGCTDVSSICTAVDFLGSLRELIGTAFTIFSVILFPTRLPVVSAVFRIALFESVLKRLVAEFFVVSSSFCLYLLFRALPMFFAKDKNPRPLIYIRSMSSIDYLTKYPYH